jgi:ATP-dependent RNA helicase DeaD
MTSSFSSLGISDVRAEYLESQGFTTPTPIQAQAIPHLLAGRDVVGQAQTGTGKTAAFGLPILERVDPSVSAVQALVLAPTRELAVQVEQAVRNFKGNDRRLKVLAIYGGQSIDRQIMSLQRGAQVVVGTPGRVIDLLDRGVLKLGSLKWMVLDEADEMLNMGFIDDVEKILAKAPTDRQTAFFSATMPPSIRNLISKFLRSPVTVSVEQPKVAPTRINQLVYMVPRGWSKSHALQPILEYEEPEAAIIFVRTRRAAAELTSQLQAAGHSVDEFHGDLSQGQRERLLQRFRQHQVRWVVATDIAARGIHVDDLTHVINYDLPDSVENYVHRIGRTGRAGKTGTAISLIQPMDRRKMRDIEAHIRQRLEVSSIPARAQIEARYLERLKTNLKEALAGERMASFLPIVSQLEEEYEAHAIAAAALQMFYDKTRPQWPQMDDPRPESARDGHHSRPHTARRSEGPAPKPKLVKRDQRTTAPSTN